MLSKKIKGYSIAFLGLLTLLIVSLFGAIIPQQNSAKAATSILQVQKVLLPDIQEATDPNLKLNPSDLRHIESSAQNISNNDFVML
ncbi:MAG: hypothetical protein J6C13_03905, partial [Clostridia bacterium]|nr:hypothetical protein [Clostridia bacterium]